MREIKSTDTGLCKVLRQRPAEGSDERHLVNHVKEGFLEEETLDPRLRGHGN